MSSRIKKKILLVNPWIHDFSAYDFWMKPLGLLYLGSILRGKGYEVSLLDCLDFRSLPDESRGSLKPPKRRDFGRGHFYKEKISKPEVLKDIPRQYCRYGIPPENLEKLLAALSHPDLILVTSLMTYWYPGLFETIGFLRQNIPGVPILLGGIYATLCFEHAVTCSGADRVLPGPWDGEKLKIISEYLGESPSLEKEDFTSWPYPAFDLYRQPEYICLLTRCGCPFSCTYCAAPRLMKKLETRSSVKVVAEIYYWQSKWGMKDFAFYDDALLIDPAGHILPLLQDLKKRGIQGNFHTPNALHGKAITEEIAALLFQTGFKTLRLGLETTNPAMQIKMGGKVDNQEFQRSVCNLRRAGYSAEEIGVYLMTGIPHQKVEEVEESMALVKKAGAKPILVEYSPIPGTPLFAEAKKVSRFDLEKEPIFHNNSILPCQGDGFTRDDLKRLKAELKDHDPPAAANS